MVASRRARRQRRPPVRALAPVLPSSVIVCLALMVAGAVLPLRAFAQQGQGEEIFQRLCVMCHTVGGGDLIGPDLRGVEGRHTEEWIIRFVQRSQQMVGEGDSAAVALFEQYLRVPMPDQALTDDEVRAVMAFTAVGESAGPAALPAATPDQIRLGQDLFQGTVRFANNGPTCNSCHDVVHDAVIGGGVLAAELTTVFTRLGGQGVRAIIGSPPFPVMQRAYLDRPLTDEEVISLVGFLEQADADQALYQPRDYGIQLFGAGLIGALLLLGLYSLAWRGRRTGSVNQKIFDRQIKSV